MAGSNEAKLDEVLRSVAYVDSARVRRDVLEAIRQAPYLVPKEDELFQEVSPGDWQPCKLLSLDGVLAYSHEGTVYYCPVQVYVQTEHPRRAPTVFVRPAADMIIERNAPYVDSSGALSLDALRSWSTTSSIAAVLREMATRFGGTSPLRRRPSSLPARGAAGGGGAGLASSASAGSEAAEATRLRAALTATLKSELAEWYGMLVRTLDEQETEGELLRSELEQERREASEAREKAELLERYVTAVRAKVEAADAWLADNEASADDVDAEASVAAAYPLHAQLLKAVARSNAIEDALDALRSALAEDRVSLKGYVRETRKQAKALFTERLVARRISAALEAAGDAASVSSADAAAAGGPPAYSGGGPPPAYGGGGGAPPAYGGGAPPAYGGGAPPAYGGGAPPAYGGGAPPAYGGSGPAYGVGRPGHQARASGGGPGYPPARGASGSGAPMPGYLR